MKNGRWKRSRRRKIWSRKRKDQEEVEERPRIRSGRLGGEERSELGKGIGGGALCRTPKPDAKVKLPEERGGERGREDGLYLRRRS